MTRHFAVTLCLSGLVANAFLACAEADPEPATPGDQGTNATSGNNTSGASDGTGGSVSATVGGAVNAVSAVSGTTGGGLLVGDVDAVDVPGAAGAAGALNLPAVSLGTNPFVVAKHDPLSTFAADVDTASYDAFRGAAMSNVTPAADTVRLEDFVNYFDYDYPAPAADAELPFQIVLDAAPNPFIAGTTLLRIGIQGKAPPALERKPTNLVFLVDVSGSMQTEDKLPLVQQVLTETVELLNSADTVSIVSYASDTRVRLAPTRVSNADAILAEIAALTAGGSTAGADGIGLAYQQAEAAYLEGGLNHVILCTDGDFNVGPSSTSELVDLIEEKRQSGVTLTVLGFGETNNDDLMEGVSNAGNGIYGKITDSAQASRYVEERMLATLVHIAKDVKLQVEFNQTHVYAYRLLGYENRAIADDEFRDDTVDAGEIGSGHRVTALYELALNDGVVPQVIDAPQTEDGAPYTGTVEVAGEDWVLVKVRYKEPGASESDAAKEVMLSLSNAELASAISASNADFRWAVAVAGFAEILKNSPYAPIEHLDTIQELISDQAFAGDPDKQEFVTLFQSVRGLL